MMLRLLSLRTFLPALLLAGLGFFTAIAAEPGEPAPAAPARAYPAPDADGKVRLADAEWKKRLAPDQFRILRGSATERPFSCELWKISDKPGVYRCAGCGLALFDSAEKFDSGTGWPSFVRPIAPGRVAQKPDDSHGMIRVETLCARCDGHLGHVFDDGPPPTGLRYCINGSALDFDPSGATAADRAPGIVPPAAKAQP